MNKKEFLFPFDFYFSSKREKERTNKQMFMYNYFLHFILTGFKSGSFMQYIASGALILSFSLFQRKRTRILIRINIELYNE